MRLEGGPNKECESVRNILFGVTGPIACLDPTAGLVSAGMSVASWQICNKMATPHRELFSCCGGDRPSAGNITICITERLFLGCVNSPLLKEAGSRNLGKPYMRDSVLRNCC